MNCTATMVAAVTGIGIAAAACAEPAPSVRREIDYLLRFISDSGCQFNRNGTWHDAKTAQAHVLSKYEFLLTLDQINTTEDFIDKAATKSSVLFGQPYSVRCDGDPPVQSSLWLSNELVRYRSLVP